MISGGSMNSKKIYLFLTLFYTTSIMPAHWQPLQEESLNPELSLELTMAKNMCLSQNERLYDDLLHIIDFTDEHLLYWQETQHTPYSYFFSKGPFKWLWGKKQETEIQDHITILQRCQSWAAHHLGQVAQLTNKLNNVTNDDEIKPLIFQTISFAKNYLAPNKTQLSLEQTITIQELTDLLNKNVQHLQDAKDQMWTMLEAHKKPGHVTRNWLYYSLGGIVAFAAGKYLHSNPDKPAEWYTSGKVGIEKFTENHILSPLIKIRDLIFAQTQDPSSASLNCNTEDEIKNLEDSIFNSASDYLAKYHHIKDQELVTEANKAVKGTSEIIIKDFQIKLGTMPITGEYNGKLGISDLKFAWHYFNDKREEAGERLAEIAKIKLGPDEQMAHLLALWGLRYDLMLKAILSDISKIFQANRLNFELLMTIPAAVLLYTSYKTTKAVAHWCMPKYNYFLPVKNLLRSIGQLLNRYNNPTVHMGPEQEGYILYWTYKLSQYVAYMPHSAQKYFAEDIQELASPNLQINQKLEIWNRMYKTYDFLTPLQGNLGTH